LVLQAAQGDGLMIDPFSLQQDYLAASAVYAGRGLGFQIGREVVVLAEMKSGEKW
jgi:hypothetical protein